MPNRHGVLFADGEAPRCLFGIWQVFDPWVSPQLQARQGQDVPRTTRPLLIEFHFRRVLQRLARSLERLYHHCREWDEFLATGALAGPKAHLTFEIPEEAGIAADSVFHYLNVFIDDVARIAHFVLTDGGAPQDEPDGFAPFMVMFEEKRVPGATDKLEELFVRLRQDESSWWSVGFRRGRGIRQRLTHYTDLLLFRGGTKPGDAVMTADVTLAAIGGGHRVPGFEATLRQLLNGLFVWLDAVAHELLTMLSERLAARGVTWNPMAEACPGIRLADIPAARAHGRRDYLYLPICYE